MTAIVQESQDLSKPLIFSILAVDVPFLLYNARRRPWVPLMMIFALAPFQHDMSVGGPVKFSIAEINLMLTCIMFVIRGRPIRWGPAIVPISVYLGICAISSVLSPHPSTLSSMIQMGLYLIAAVVVFTGYVKEPEDFRPALYGLLVVGFILASAVIVLRIGLCLRAAQEWRRRFARRAVIVCAELWFAAGAAAPKTILSWCWWSFRPDCSLRFRAAAGWARVLGIIVILAMRRQFKLMVQVGVVMVPLMAICWHFLPAAIEGYTTGLSKDNWNIEARYKSVYFAEDLLQPESDHRGGRGAAQGV